MTPNIYVALVLGMALSGLAMASLQRLAHTEWAARHRTRREIPRRVPAAEHLRSRVVNTALTLVMFFGPALWMDGRIVSRGVASPGRTVAEVVAVLVLYDFGYYLLHRGVFHAWPTGRRWHAVHHRIRSPFAEDAMFIHPVETALGIALFMACPVLVATVAGPVSGLGFLIAFVLYSVMNVLIHSAMHLDLPKLPLVSRMIAAHDLHHGSMKGGNYSSISPAFDLLFGTAQSE